MIDGERWLCRHRIAAAGFCTITAVLCVALAARWVRGGEDDRSVDLEKLEQFGGAREQYQKAEKVMKAALYKAHEYEHRAAVQSHLEGKDERMHYELVKAARDRADELRRQDRKVSQISDVRERMEDALRATTAVLMLHEKRLEDVMGQERTSTVKATRLQEDVDGLEKSAGNMQASVQNLKLQTEEMKRRFKVEEHDTSSTKTSQDLEKLLTQYASKKVKETDRELAAKSKERAARASARSKQAEALQLQARADLIQEQLVNLNCYEKFSKTGLGFIPYGSQLSKALDKKKESTHEKEALKDLGSDCDPATRVSLENELAALKSQITVLEQEVVYEQKQAQVMAATARLQKKMAHVDGYKAAGYRARLEQAQTSLELQHKDLVMAPNEIKAAEMNLELASQAAERVQERLRIFREKQRTDFAEQSKAKAIAHLQAREISKIDKLKQSQEHAMLAAARVEAAEGSIVAAQSGRVQRLMRQARALQRDALAHSKVAARWDSAATMEMKEAGAYAHVAQDISKAHKLEHSVADTSRQASQMRHGLQLMAVESAIRRFKRDPSRPNRAELERLEKLLEDRLGKADDAAENDAGIQELNSIEDELDGIDKAPAAGQAPPQLTEGTQEERESVSVSVPLSHSDRLADAEKRFDDAEKRFSQSQQPELGQQGTQRTGGRGSQQERQPSGYMYTAVRGADGRWRRGEERGRGRLRGDGRAQTLRIRMQNA